jgi:opacity protein-like surface antigen
MRRVHETIAAIAITVALPAVAAAQVSQTPPPTPPQNERASLSYPNDSYWTAAGFVGSNFGARADESSVQFGGHLAYLYRGVIGGEVLADFAPHFQINNPLLAGNPMVNAYMGNIIGAVPIGSQARVQPYVSGGLGVVQLSSSDIRTPLLPTSNVTTSSNQTSFGGNIGAGVMGFAGNFGVRADVRYFRAFNSGVSTDPNVAAADLFARNLLSGLDFWRANLGIAVRW